MAYFEAINKIFLLLYVDPDDKDGALLVEAFRNTSK